MLHPSNKEKKRKEILNNDLAVLLSHDTISYSRHDIGQPCLIPLPIFIACSSTLFTDCSDLA